LVCKWNKNQICKASILSLNHMLIMVNVNLQSSFTKWQMGCKDWLQSLMAYGDILELIINEPQFEIGMLEESITKNSRK